VASLLTTRPRPPAALAEGMEFDQPFQPAHDALAWVRAVFLDPASPMFNPEHEHLQDAVLGILWAGMPNASKGRRVLGTAEFVQYATRGNAWQKARAEQQLRAWFGETPDFVITLDAYYCATCPDAEFCALVEHELYHCAQATDEEGGLKFTRDGARKFTLRGHDIEEFVGVVRRYGADAAGVARLVEAASSPPEIAPVRVAQVCGTCLLRAA
jgi:hypothetical protein